ncbi:exonuclease 3'-5' domain-containing protein 2-like isoform X2 [Dysidea avara]
MCGCQVNGCVDLRYLYIRSGLHVEDPLSLKSLTRLLLEMELPKSHHIRCSNWEAVPLTNSQIYYAAADAAVAVDIVDVLVKRKLQRLEERELAAEHSLMQPKPHPLIAAQLLHEHSTVKYCDKLKNDTQDDPQVSNECHSKDIRFTKEVYSCLFSMCQGIVDLPYRHKPYIPDPSSYKSSRAGPAPSKAHNKPHQNQSVNQQHNCQLLAPDGPLVATASRKKLEETNLGEMVDESPLTAKLQPKEHHPEDNSCHRRRICVVCGEEEKNFIHKHVIPLEYRKHFPVHMKERFSHDVLLLCPLCHQLSCQQDSYYREYLVSYYNAPVNGTGKLKGDVWLQQVRNHARALQNHHKIPEARVYQLMDTLKTFYRVDDITDHMIQEAANIDPRSANDDFISHGQKVVETVTQEGKLIEFQISWRKHFLDSMKPQYLPPQWSIYHNPISS